MEIQLRQFLENKFDLLGNHRVKKLSKKFGKFKNFSYIYYVKLRDDKKKIVYIDMDGALVDFGKPIDDWFTNHPHLEDRYKTFPRPHTRFI